MKLSFFLFPETQTADADIHDEIVLLVTVEQILIQNDVDISVHKMIQTFNAMQ